MSNSSELYLLIFTTNVLKHLRKKGMTLTGLNHLSGVSISFLSGLKKGTANPSVKTAASIAEALGVPLPSLFEDTDLSDIDINDLFSDTGLSEMPGYERVSVVLPTSKARIVKEWEEKLTLSVDNDNQIY